MQDVSYMWLLLLGAVIATTIQFQDLYNQLGECARGRRTLPLIVGDRYARISIAFSTAVWSIICRNFWGLNVLGFALPLVLGSTVIFRLFRYQSVVADKRSFKIWNAWIVVLYFLPMIKAAA